MRVDSPTTSALEALSQTKVPATMSQLIVCKCATYSEALKKARRISEILRTQYTSIVQWYNKNSFEMECDFGTLQACTLVGNPEQDVVLFTIDYEDESFVDMLDFMLALDLARNATNREWSTQEQNT